MCSPAFDGHKSNFWPSGSLYLFRVHRIDSCGSSIAIIGTRNVLSMEYHKETNIQLIAHHSDGDTVWTCKDSVHHIHYTNTQHKYPNSTHRNRRRWTTRLADPRGLPRRSADKAVQIPRQCPTNNTLNIPRQCPTDNTQQNQRQHPMCQVQFVCER